MSSPPPDEPSPLDDPAIADRAEEVRAWLVARRGGAIFLSPADARLLAEWLAEGVAVTAILRAIDRIADRRLARRTRGALKLVHCKAEVRRQVKAVLGPPPADLAARLDGGDPDPRVRETLTAIAALDDPDPEGRARAACGIVRRFHESIWDGLGEGRAAILADAARELEDLKDLLSEAEFLAAIEERAREGVRKRYPKLSATRIWEEFGVGMD